MYLHQNLFVAIEEMTKNMKKKTPMYSCKAIGGGDVPINRLFTIDGIITNSTGTGQIAQYGACPHIPPRKPLYLSPKNLLTANETPTLTTNASVTNRTMYFKLVNM